MTVNMHTKEPPKPWIQTPLVESSALSKAAGCRIFLKLENIQPSGSFKSRGVGNFILQHHNSLLSSPSSPPPNLHLFSSSGGNAGLAAVHASNTLGHPCTVVVPLSTKPLMIAKLKAAGAKEVIQFGESWRDADTYLREHVLAEVNSRARNGDGEVHGLEKEREVGVYVPPFDHPLIWAGNESIVEEVDQQLGGAPEAVICSVGGGGLFNGIAQGVKKAGWDDTTILALETKGADSLAQSLQKGELVTLKGITSLATSLGATRVSERTFELAQGKNVRSVVLDDAEAAMGCWRLADDERMLVELACGVNVALCYDGRLEKALGRRLSRESKVVIVVCGGSNVTVGMIEQWRREFGAVEERIGINGAAANGEVPSSHTAPNRM